MEPGHLINLDYSRASAYSLAVGASWGRLDIFFLVYYFSFLSSCPWETARYKLKCCLKGPLSPKQPTNQPTTLTKQAYQKSWYSEDKQTSRRKTVSLNGLVYSND